ncbi:MAG: S8 family serine peptidase [Verrucomicrobiia bacterium]
MQILDDFSGPFGTFPTRAKRPGVETRGYFRAVPRGRGGLIGACVAWVRNCLFAQYVPVACLWFLFALSPVTHGQASFVRYGKHNVHPTRILAKLADRARLESTVGLLDSVGLEVRERVGLVEGLVILDLAEGGARVGKKNAFPSDLAGASSLLQARVHALEDSGLFDYVQPSYVYTNLLVPNDARFGDNTLWGLRNTGAAGGLSGSDIGAVRAWDITTGSTNVVVAVIDSGIRYTHQELAGQMWRNPKEIPGNGIDDDRNGFVDDIYGPNPAGGNGDPMDDNDHGTHVAGTIGAAANDGFPHVGVAWKVRLMACKFLGSDGFGTTDDAIRCLNYAVEQGARVINASWGGGPFERALLDALTAARRRGVLFVAASGNDFSDNDAYAFYPASYRLDNVISVASLDRRDRLSSFSNFGRTSVHLGAPGESIYSCTASSDSAYEALDGTSMAAPHVAGVAALILAEFPNASVPEIRERLLSTAVPVAALDGKALTGGRVNAFLALSATPDGSLELGFDPPENSDLSARRPVRFTVTVTDLTGVTNATVRASIQSSGAEVQFRNDGAGGDEVLGDEVYTGDLTLPVAPGPFEILFAVSAPGKESISRSVTYNIAAPPLNDHFADALDIPPEGGLLQWTNRFATIEPGEPQHAQAPSAAGSVWWNWTPSATTPVMVDTAGSSFDTVLAVYTNNTLSALKTVAFGDDAGGKKQGRATFTAARAVAYHIVVAGYSAADFGTIRLRVEPDGGPDTNAPLVTITGPASGLTVTNATDPKLVVTGTALDPVPNASGVRQVQVQVNRNVASTALGTTNWSSTVLLREGQNRIKVSATDYAGNSSPIRTVMVNYEPLISPNDLFANAFELEGTSGSATGNNTRAGRERGEPFHGEGGAEKSIWWVYRPVTDGVLSLSTASSSFDTLLALYDGGAGGVGSLEPLAGNDNADPDADSSSLQQPLKAGQTCFIAVDGVDGSSGVVELEFSFLSVPVWRVALSAGEGGSTAPDRAFYEGGSRIELRAVPDPFFQFDSWQGSVTSTENPLPVIVLGDLEFRAIFRPIEFSDGFETGDFSALPWLSSGRVPWTIQSGVVQAGSFAARSGEIGNGQRSSLLLTDVFRAGAAAFGVRVSSEPTWDILEFFLNGARLNRWAGDVAWTEFKFEVPAGTNTLEWRYSKDFFDTKAGFDAAFIDNLNLPLRVPVDSTTPARLAVRRLPSGAVELTVTGQNNQVYSIESSSAWGAWTPVSTNSVQNGVIRWIATPDPADTAVFYRAVVR